METFHSSNAWRIIYGQSVAIPTADLFPFNNKASVWEKPQSSVSAHTTGQNREIEFTSVWGIFFSTSSVQSFKSLIVIIIAKYLMLSRDTPNL